MLTDAMTRQRVIEGEVRQAIRSQGIGSIEDVSAVVLETDGSFSVLSRSQAGSGSSLQDVREPLRERTDR
ncbi:YetF domain-containing protein [Streptomyces sp. NPDC057217]|uniref:YetF domain-containing protein n=1 Tax=Streptomyces sp. NPDC057217 TaxID=3346054 RepID=UPI00363C1C52